MARHYDQPKKGLNMDTIFVIYLVITVIALVSFNIAVFFTDSTTTRGQYIVFTGLSLTPVFNIVVAFAMVLMCINEIIYTDKVATWLDKPMRK
jgi:hypothetical protein